VAYCTLVKEARAEVSAIRSMNSGVWLDALVV